MKIRSKLGMLAVPVVAALAAVVGATGAQAATTGDTCRISSTRTITVTAVWSNLSSPPAVTEGDVNYFWMSAPFGIKAVKWVLYDRNGDWVIGTSPLYYNTTLDHTSGGTYYYKMGVGARGHYISVDPMGAGGTTCDDYGDTAKVIAG